MVVLLGNATMKKVINIAGTLVLVMLLLVVGGIRLHAQELKFDVSGPNSVPVGGQVTIKYSFNNDARLDQPDFGDFIYVGGPSRGQSSYTSIVNGKVSSETSFTYTYYLQAPEKTGTYTIPAAKATYQGKSYTCNSMTIEVHKGAQGSSSTTSTSARPSQPGTTSSEDLYLVLELDKTNPYSGEPVTASLVLYSDPKLPLSNLEFVNTPEFPGFYKEELDQPDDIPRQDVKVGNRTYTAYTLQQVVL